MKPRHRPVSPQSFAEQLGHEAYQGIGNDLRSDSKLWSMYARESMEYDKVMLKSWNDALDVLLIMVNSFHITYFMYPSNKKTRHRRASSLESLQHLSSTRITCYNLILKRQPSLSSSK